MPGEKEKQDPPLPSAQMEGEKTEGDVEEEKNGRKDDTERTRIDKELRGYISDLPPSVDKLKEIADRAVQESKELRREARRTTSASNIRRATLK